MLELKSKICASVCIIIHGIVIHRKSKNVVINASDSGKVTKQLGSIQTSPIKVFKTLLQVVSYVYSTIRDQQISVSLNLLLEGNECSDHRNLSVTRLTALLSITNNHIIRETMFTLKNGMCTLFHHGS